MGRYAELYSYDAEPQESHLDESEANDENDDVDDKRMALTGEEQA